jgi:cell division protein FtsB
LICKINGVQVIDTGEGAGVARNSSARKQRTSGGRDSVYGNGVIDIEEAQRLRREKREQSSNFRKRKASALEPEPVYDEIAVEDLVAPVKRMSFGKKLISIVIAVVLLVFIGVSFLHTIELKQEQKTAESALAEKQLEKKKLERELAHINDPEYVEEQARERLRMIKNGETLYVFNTQESNSVSEQDA